MEKKELVEIIKRAAENLNKLTQQVNEDSDMFVIKTNADNFLWLLQQFNELNNSH